MREQFLSVVEKNKIEKTVKIDSLQSLRAIAFVGVFLCHSHAPFSWSALGVSIFFVLSGFLLTRKYGENITASGLKENINFSIKRIKKLYPLHIVTMCCAVALEMLGCIVVREVSLKESFILILKIICNVLLVQAWIPSGKINTSLNGVSWYLSASMFIYFMFPYLKNHIIKKNKKRIFVEICFVLLIQVLFCVLFVKHMGGKNEIYIWFMYFFPLFRLGDFYIGCSAARLFAVYTNKNSRLTLKWSLAEVVLLAFSILIISWPFDEQNKNIFFCALHNWTTPYIPLAVAWLYLFLRQQGILTKCLSNDLLIKLGDISGYAFLIHFVVTCYTNSIINFLGVELSGIQMWIVICLEFVVTVIISMLYIKVKSVINSQIEYLKRRKFENE